MGLTFKNKKNEVLILKDSANSISPLIFGLVLLLVGGLFGFFGYFSPVLECHNIGGTTNCELTRQGLFPFKTHRIILNNFSGAEVKTHEDSDGDTYSIVLNAANAAAVPFANYSSSGYNSKLKLVRKIQNNINTQKDFTVKYSQNVLLGIGIFLSALGLLILWSGIKYAIMERSALEADLTQGILKIYPYNFSKKYEDVRPIADVQDISIAAPNKYWKQYALYMQTLCQVKGIAMPIAVKIMLKAAGLLGAGNDEGKENEDSRRNTNQRILVIKLKDLSEFYVLLPHGNSENAVSEFKKYLGFN